MPTQPRRKCAPHPSRYVINGESADLKVTYHRTQTTWLPHSVECLLPISSTVVTVSQAIATSSTASLRGTKQSCAFFALIVSPPEQKMALIATLRLPTECHSASEVLPRIHFSFFVGMDLQTLQAILIHSVVTTTCLPGRRFPSTSWWSTFHELLVENWSQRLCAQRSMLMMLTCPSRMYPENGREKGISSALPLELQ